MSDLKIEQVDPKALKPAEYNPRKMTKAQAVALRESITRFGLADPIIANRHPGRENIVIGGHQRLTIAKEMNMPTVPVVYLDLDEKQERELNLRLNRNLGEFDWDLLANYDVKELLDAGFYKEELEKRLKIDLSEVKEDGDKPPSLEPIAKLGDVYQLGRHRLMVGDSTNPEHFAKLMNGKLARLVYTDPPYNVNYDYNVRYFDGRKERQDRPAIFNDELSDGDFEGFLSKVMKNLYDFSTPDSSIYVWHASKTYPQFLGGYQSAGWFMSQIIIWLKENITFSTGQDFHRIYEPCMYGWKKGNSHYTNKLLGSEKEVWDLNKEDFANLLDVWYQNRDKSKDYIHPTQKPVKLAELAIRKSSEEGDIVLDAFTGSGSTMMACEQMNRSFYGMELDPKYADAIIKRWEEFTKQTAVKQ